MPCRFCYDPDPRHAWELWRGFLAVAKLVDESHFWVTLMRCADCGQAYASTFSEWTDSTGYDFQDSLVIALGPAEAQALSAAPTEAVEAALKALPPRRYLLYQREREPQWLRGKVWVPPHD